MLNQLAVELPTTSRPLLFLFIQFLVGMLSRAFGVPSRREGPPSIWDTHGISGNVFANPVASSSAPYPEGVSVSQSSLSVVFDRTGETCGRKKYRSVNWFKCHEKTRTVLTASFLKTPKLRKWSIEQGNLWEKAAQMHRLGPCLMNRDK